MPKPKTAEECGMDPHWKVRIYLPGGILYVISRTEPVVHIGGKRLAHVELDVIEGTDHGDTIGFMDWEAVLGVTWRFAF